jgi:general secretion pathway protein E
LVLSTLHTNDAPSAVTRLLELGVPPYLVSSTIVGVMAQRLVRTLCPLCKQPDELEPALWNALVAPWKAPVPTKAHKAVGCLECRMTGFMGRVGLYEMLPMTNELRRLVATVAHPNAIKDQAIKDGLRPLKLAGAQKIAAGQTTIDEVMKVVPSDQD